MFAFLAPSKKACVKRNARMPIQQTGNKMLRYFYSTKKRNADITWMSSQLCNDMKGKLTPSVEDKYPNYMPVPKVWQKWFKLFFIPWRFQISQELEKHTCLLYWRRWWCDSIDNNNWVYVCNWWWLCCWHSGSDKTLGNNKSVPRYAFSRNTWFTNMSERRRRQRNPRKIVTWKLNWQWKAQRKIFIACSWLVCCQSNFSILERISAAAFLFAGMSAWKLLEVAFLCNDRVVCWANMSTHVEASIYFYDPLRFLALFKIMHMEILSSCFDEQNGWMEADKFSCKNGTDAKDEQPSVEMMAYGNAMR